MSAARQGDRHQGSGRTAGHSGVASGYFAGMASSGIRGLTWFADVFRRSHLPRVESGEGAWGEGAWRIPILKTGLERGGRERCGEGTRSNDPLVWLWGRRITGDSDAVIGWNGRGGRVVSSTARNEDSYWMRIPGESPECSPTPLDRSKSGPYKLNFILPPLNFASCWMWWFVPEQLPCWEERTYPCFPLPIRRSRWIIKAC